MMQTMADATEGGAAVEMPRYKCHKEVWALKIKSVTKANPPTIQELQDILDEKINPTDEEIVGAIIEPEEEGYAAFPVSRKFMLKHDPQVGGYYVVYADGYKSFSPAKAFEEGYTRG